MPPVLSNPSGCGLGLPINDASCDASHFFQVQVVNAPGQQLGTDVFLREVRIVVRHEWVADLDMRLRSPSGIEVELSTDNGSGNDNYGEPTDCSGFTAFLSPSSQNACNAPNITGAQAPFIGEFMPEGNLNHFNDGTDPNNIWTLIVCDDGASNYGTLEFVELVFEATACISPSGLVAQAVDSTSATLDWLPGSSCGQTVVEFGTPGFIPGIGASAGQGTVVPGACPPFSLDSLLPNFEYEVYVREICQPGVFSGNSCPVFLRTNCSPPPPTIIEHFNQQALCATDCGAICPVEGTWRNAPNDHFDWIVNEGTTSTPQTGPDGDFPGGGRYLYLETSGSLCRNGNSAYLVSNCIEVHGNPDSCDFSFDYNFNGANVGGVWLDVTTDGGASWQNLWSATGNLGNRWRKKFIELGDFEGMTVQFRFVGKGGGGTRGDLALDNLVFYGSIDLGLPPFVKYQDADGDGSGNPDRFVAACADVPVAGYVDNPQDCNDTDFFTNPAADEVFCDGLDQNCNGFGDEYFLHPPTTFGASVCADAPAYLVAVPSAFGQIVWYDSLTGGSAVGLGDTLFLDNAWTANASPDTLVQVFFAEETSANGCVTFSRQPVELQVLPRPDIAVNNLPTGCAGTPFQLNTLDVVDQNGVNGSLSFYQNQPFSSQNEVGPVVAPFFSTNYYVLIKSEAGCLDTAQVYFEVLPSPAALIVGDTTMCRNTSQQLFAVDAGEGLGPLQFQWNTGAASGNIQVSSNSQLGGVNQYAVTITGTNGCASSDTMAVKTIVSVSSVQTLTQPVTTCGGTNGTATLNPLNGTPPYTYQWQGGIVTQPSGHTFSGLAQGSYSFTITDSSQEGCALVVPTVVVNGPSATVSIASVSPVSCHGGNDGCIQLNTFGNSPTITWDNGLTGPANCGLSAGTYTITVAEGACETVLSVPVYEPEPLLAKPGIDHVNCFGGNDGVIELAVFGGTSGYSFEWENGSTNPTLGQLPAGFYDVTVTDANACSVQLVNIPVVQPSQLVLDTLALLPPTCFGLQNGQLAVAAAGGTTPYTYHWSNGGLGSSLSNLPDGAFVVTVLDGGNCQLEQQIQLTQPEPIQVILDSVDPPLCEGNINGAIWISVVGGSGSNSFTWSNGQATEDLVNIGAGHFSVAVTDRNGCQGGLQAIPVVGPVTMNLSFDVTAPSCVGDESGAITASVHAGGVAPFHFNWSIDESGETISSLPPGEYIVTVTDSLGCEADSTVVLPDIQVISVTVEAFPPACHGTSTGELDLMISGGMAPYQVFWSHGQTGAIAKDLPAGNYTAEVFDANGCNFFTGLIPLEEPDLLAITLQEVESIACSGGSEGAVDITVTGGSAPYQLLWSNGGQSADLTNLSAGTYSVSATDENGCVAVLKDIVVSSPEPLQPESSLVVPPGCAPVQVDTVCVSVTGGLAPYGYVWDTGDTTGCLVGAASGDYHVTITDAAGCTIEFMSIKVPEEFFPVSVEQVPTGEALICAATNTGALEAVIVGGAPPFQYIWSDGEIGTTVNDTILNTQLSTGSYSVTITDAVGCTAVSEMMTIGSAGFIVPQIPGGQLQHVKCKGGTDGAINLYVTGGISPFGFLWTDENGQPVGQMEDLSGIPAGEYTVVVTDQIGCTGSASVEIFQPTTEISLDSVPPLVNHVSCFSGNDGSVFLFPTGGITPYFFDWGNVQGVPGMSELAAGMYAVTVSDQLGCEKDTVFEITAPLAPLALASLEMTKASCFGSTDGFLDIEMGGGTEPYSFNWGASSTEEDLYNIGAGTYHLAVADFNGCTFQQSFTITSPSEILLALGSSPATVGQADGQATVAATGGVPPYDFLWDNGETADTAVILVAGNHSVTVTDANDCEVVGWVWVDMTSSVMEFTDNEELILFPNPAAGPFYLKSAKEIAPVVTASLMSGLGQKFPAAVEKLDASTLRVTAGELPAGLYFFQIQFEGGAAAAFEVLYWGQ